jgi:hypothetical protein
VFGFFVADGGGAGAGPRKNGAAGAEAMPQWVWVLIGVAFRHRPGSDCRQVTRCYAFTSQKFAR